MRDLRSELIGLRLASVSGGCLRVLRAASVVGREFDISMVRRMAVVRRSRLDGILDEARASGVTEPSPGAPGRLRFVHQLMRDSVYEGMPGSLRGLLHRSVGEILEAAPSGPDAFLSQLAHHFCAGVGGREKAFRYALAAGDEAVARLAFEEGERLYTMGLAALLGSSRADL